MFTISRNHFDWRDEMGISFKRCCFVATWIIAMSVSLANGYTSLDGIKLETGEIKTRVIENGIGPYEGMISSSGLFDESYQYGIWNLDYTGQTNFSSTGGMHCLIHKREYSGTDYYAHWDTKSESEVCESGSWTSKPQDVTWCNSFYGDFTIDLWAGKKIEAYTYNRDLNLWWTIYDWPTYGYYSYGSFCGAPLPNTNSTTKTEYSSSYTFKVNCPGGKIANQINITGASFYNNYETGIQINSMSPVQSGSEFKWVIPVTAKCGDLVTLTPKTTGEGLSVVNLVRISAVFECILKIDNYLASRDTFNPKANETVQLSGNLSEVSDWILTIGDRELYGRGSNFSVVWDGKDNHGAVVPDGIYTAILKIQNADRTCSDSRSIDIEVKSTCDLTATLKGPGIPGTEQPFQFDTGATYSITGAYTTSSNNSVNWTLTLPDGKTSRGNGSSISAKWDGTLLNGTLAPVGDYVATLIVTSSEDPDCSATATLPITVAESNSENSCSLAVTFGSTVHVVNGNLAHNQELFSSRRGIGLTLYYNSLNSANDALGRGWSHNYNYTLKENRNGSVVINEPNWLYRYYTYAGSTYIASPGNYAALVKNVDGSFILTHPDGQTYRYVDGKIAAISDRNGNTINLSYSSGNLASVIDQAGRTITFVYDDANHLTSLIAPNGNGYAFSVGTGLDSVTQQDGSTWHYSYDGNGFMLGKTDPLGNTTNYSYDARHRAVSATDPVGLSRTIAYPETSDTVKTTILTEKDGSQWSYRYDTQKRYLLAKTDPQEGTTSYTYNDSGNRIGTTYPDGTSTSASYDNRGNMLSSTDALVQTTTYTYNTFGQITASTDPQGAITTYGYDAMGNMTSLTDVTGGTTTYAYGTKGNLTKMTDPQGAVTTYTYDTVGNLTSITDPNNATTSYSYDASGNMISSTDPQGGVTTFTYNSSNRLIKTVDPLGNVATYSYDASGNRLSSTDENGNTTRYQYNSRNRLIATIDALNNITSYAYGGSSCPSCGGGNGEKITSLTDAGGNTTRYLYDQLGRLSKETDPLGNETNYSYDVKGNLAIKTDPNGSTSTYSYDASGRLLKKTYPDNTEETFTYDPKGNILTATNKHVAYSFSYDAAGRMLSSTDSTGRAIAYVYDIRGNKTQMIAPDGTAISYGYDKSGRLASSITNGDAYTYSYTSRGQRAKLIYPNGDSASYAYDSKGNLTSLFRKNSSGTIISSNSYGLDKTGNRLTNTTPERISSYSYDNIYRLLQTITNTPGNSSNTKTSKGTSNAVQQQKEFFSYDPVGNRLTSEKTKNYSYNQNNQLTTNGGSYSYDRNGNLIQKTTVSGSTLYEWDYENRLTRVVTPTITAEYAYDPFGRRIAKRATESGITTTATYFYDGQSIILEYDETGAIVNRYLHGPNIDEPLSVTTSKEKYYYHADGLGSIVALTDKTGKVVQTYEYDSFGNLKDQKNRIKQPFTYTGREYDRETGLYYYRARYYVPMEGRFASKDPIGFKGGINLYSYVLNNPLRYKDPYGQDVYVQNTTAVGGWHRRIVVDTPSGPYGISFGMSSRDAEMDGWSAASGNNPTPGGLGVGVVYPDNIDAAVKEVSRFSSTPCEDEVIEKYLKSLVGNTGQYHYLTNSCRNFSDREYANVVNMIMQLRAK